MDCHLNYENNCVHSEDAGVDCTGGKNKTCIFSTAIDFFQLLVHQRVVRGSLVVIDQVEEQCGYASMEYGALFVITSGIYLTLEWCANN